MPHTVRPLTSEDSGILVELDRRYAAAAGAEELVDDGSVGFFARSGHAFVLERAGEAVGFLLAQPLWNGRRPTALVSRFVALDDAGRQALLEALTKSAYDSGVYDIVVHLPPSDEEGAVALTGSNFRPGRIDAFVRILGSRSASLG